MVSEWNATASDALIVKAGQVPTVALLNLAMVHGAVYDAVNAIDRRHEPYLVAPRGAKRSSSKSAAAAIAAYRVLADLVPEQRAALDERYADSLARIRTRKMAKAGGVAVGNAAAATMVAARSNEGRDGPFRFPIGSERGQRRPEPPLAFGDPFAWVARVEPLLIKRPSQFRSEGPNALTSAQYARELAEVQRLGSATRPT
jgi:hypothetical protein